MSPKHIFKAYDIRGKYPEELNEDTARRVGGAVVRFFSKKYNKQRPVILVGKDVRRSSDPLARALMDEMALCGAIVRDAGILTTPFFYYLMHKKGIADGGVMITASHNPPIYNGFKIRGRKAEPISLGKGLEKIKIYADKIQPHAKKLGTIDVWRAPKEEYLRFLTQGVEIKHIRVVIDAGGGATSFFLPELLSRFPELTYKPLFFEPDGTFKRHPPNPLEPEAQKYIKKEIREGGFRFGVIFDADGDRAVFFDENGEFIKPEYIGALLAVTQKKQTSVFSLNTSRGARNYIASDKNKVVISKVGATHVREAMQKSKAEIGTETSGHFYFKKFFYDDSAFLAFLRITELLSQTARPLSQLVKPMQTYVSSGELSFPSENPKLALRRVKDFYRHEKISLLDGVTVESRDWWLLVRPSNTEPIIRLLVEAKTEKLLNEKLIEAKRIITQ